MTALTERYLLAAQEAHISALQQLPASCALVGVVCELIHQLQRERGISNIFLASASVLFASQREQQLQHSMLAAQQLYTALNFPEPQLAAGSRLFSKIALALQGMDQLDTLRNHIVTQHITPLQATAAFSRLIAVWLAVVLELADLACDANISRSLVALFNLLQTKEYAGQERAWGAMGLASGQLDAELAQRLALLQHAQQDSADTFLQFASVEQSRQWRALQNNASGTQLQQLRQLIHQLAGSEHTIPAISDIWYQLATDRMDAMHQLQGAMLVSLQRLATAGLRLARQQLRSQRHQLSTLADLPQDDGFGVLFDPAMPGLYGASSVLMGGTSGFTAPNRVFYQLLSEQARQISQMQAELSDARQAVDRQKRIDRAKLLLMQHKQLSEEQAYRQLQHSAMQRQCKIADIAEVVIHALCAE